MMCMHGQRATPCLFAAAITGPHQDKCLNPKPVFPGGFAGVVARWREQGGGRILPKLLEY